MASIRLKGLVSHVHRVREQLVAGIPADQADDYRTAIKKTIEQVEQVCAAHHSTPRRLPRPSYHAYRFLKSLDLDHLPLRDLQCEPPRLGAAPPLKVRNLLRTREHVQAELARMAGPSVEASLPLTGEPPRIPALLAQIQSAAAQVEEMARQAHSHVARLALPSRQAYEWIKFLSDPENLQSHLNALRCAHVALKDIEGQKRYAGGPFRLTLEFYHTASEWSVRRKGTNVHATFSEGFIGADSTVVQALVRMAFHARRKTYRQTVHTYASGDEFAETLQAIELPTAELDPDVRGRHYDLREVFDRVNHTYFDGRLTPPRLTWNKSLTYWLMGHYQYATDTVMVSISLDSSEIPEYVIDHVMHHELLHRILGVQVVNGRRYAHTPGFRTAERSFRDFERADAFLNQWSAKLRRRS